jgi:wobble nucleotide-excising tRNase
LLQDVLKEKDEVQATISVLQLQVVNVDHAVSEINRRLVNMGIDSFRIEKHGKNAYKLSRHTEGAPTFQTLSEGEKTVISFLYFVELCKGQLDPGQVLQRKILVIDDPISSLSHLYVFNIGRAIREELCTSPSFEKIIVLTHSLYFFYELTDTNHKRRNETQKLVRLVKGADGARFEKMSYESIQNDYHSYWSVIKDQSGSPALIANCMRSVIEYFFGFVKKASLENVFASLKEPHHQAFYRYVNRESHSIGQNIYDFKEFDYDQFRECLRHVFCEQGFEEHYEAMMAK